MPVIRDFLDGFKGGFRRFSLQVAGAVNFVLLSFVYVFGVGPVSLLYRLSGRHFLDAGKKEGSYYVKRELGGGRREDYLRQF